MTTESRPDEPRRASDMDPIAVTPYVLVLGTADWDQAIATNQHYVVRELCRGDSMRVSFVESLALRRPQLAPRDINRIFRRVRAALGQVGRLPSAPRRRRPEGLEVCSPLVIPFHSGPVARINRIILEKTIADWIAYRGPKLLWAYSPVTYGLENYADEVIYHCVDLLGTVPRISKELIEVSEQHLARSGALAIATSQVVQIHLRDMGFPSVRLWENVADTEVIAAARPLHAKRVAGRVIFAGNLAPNKVDFGLLESLADAGLNVCVAGPRTEGGGSDADAFASLVAHGVHYLGMLTLEELATELVQSTVGVIPYVLNDYTRGVSPLKTFEYLAAGLAVVSTAIPGVDKSLRGIWTESTTEAFVERARSLAVVPSDEAVRERISTARDHSWTRRGEQVRGLVAGER